MNTVALMLGWACMTIGGCLVVSWLAYICANWSYRNWITVSRYREFRLWFRQRRREDEAMTAQQDEAQP